LIDVVVEDGFRKGDVNRPEARFIVDEIKQIVSDPRMARRTIGVVSLLADKQALEVWERLNEELGPEVIERHHIACGDARTFQGKERDIMFLSMVSAPNDVGAPLSRDTFAQRFNVAASRAKDRMYLVRSVDAEHLSNADRMRRSLITHFATPFAQDETRVQDLRGLCESPFERELYDELAQRGYWITPQVKVGQYRIDMVVEGHNDARLAIECDGDRYHGAEKWAEDMQRQRVLERAGWVFWRCFASTFIRRRRQVLDDLLRTLSARSVEPIGAEGAPRSSHTEQRRICALRDLAPNDTEKQDGAPEQVTQSTESEVPGTPSNTRNGPSARNRLGAALAIDIPTLQNYRRRNTQFSSETEPELDPASRTDAAAITRSLGPSDREIIEFCQRHGLETRDLRYKKGALWVFYLVPGDDIARQLEKWGFRLAKGKGYWRS
jgi:very-short-patch-repair endonuclease